MKINENNTRTLHKFPVARQPTSWHARSWNKYQSSSDSHSFPTMYFELMFGWHEVMFLLTAVAAAIMQTSYDHFKSRYGILPAIAAWVYEDLQLTGIDG
eukprot:scaffold3515_cov126-Cylindrotheca_fusiformis.AAC.21